MLPFTLALLSNCLSASEMSSTTFSVTLHPSGNSYSDTYVNEVAILAFACFHELHCLLAVLISYPSSLAAFLRIHSPEGRHKAFSTWSSHLMLVTIFSGTILFMCLHPSSSFSVDQEKWYLYCI